LQMCHCRPTYYILYIVICDINMTTFDKGSQHCLVRGIIIFSGGLVPLIGLLDNPLITCNRRSSGCTGSW